MPVRIQEIHVKNLGPLKTFSMELGLYNLVYGKNERGKTYLVEFLVKSLFRNPRQWKLREIKGSGKVIVQGLNGDLVEFGPLGSLKKMEDFWEKSSVGLPVDFSKLLVVKGAEVDLDAVDGGVDKTILKHYLSSQKILDQIDGKIKESTIKKARIVNGLISGDDKGEIQTRSKLKIRLNSLNGLFAQISKEYSGGQGKMLRDEIEQIEIQIEKMEKAKAYKAFQLD
ncbi:hypothetical protein MUP95_05080, partial [bacterium]|nr:hypothetical protein [bacterium]